MPVDREPRTSALSDHRTRTHVLLIALPRHSWDWLVLFGPRSVDQQQRLLYLIAPVEPQEGGPGVRYPRAPRLGPWAFNISFVNSFWGNFVWLYIFIHAPISSLPVPLLSLSGAGYWIYRSRLSQLLDPIYHYSDRPRGRG